MKSFIFKIFSVHAETFSNSSGLKSVFDVLDGRPSRRKQAAFLISSGVMWMRPESISGPEIMSFTITAGILARSLANFYRQYADRHMNLKFVRRVSERERAIRPFVIVKNKLMSVLMSLSCY